MKPTEDVYQFPENGMSAPETKLTVETTDGAYQPDSLLSFSHANREVLRITHDGRMIKGEGLSTEEATQEAAKLLIQAFEEQIQKMVDARVAADTARLDWLGKSSFAKFYEGPCVWRINGDEKTEGDTLRDSIDAAMKEASQ